MEWVLNSKDALPIKFWCKQKDVEENVLEQAGNLARHPAAFKFISLMADAHLGYGMPIGGVAAFNKAICPNAVGKDIGCGMRFASTNIPASFLFDYGDTGKSLGEIVRDTVPKVVPMGFSRHKEPQVWSGFDRAPSLSPIEENLEVAEISLGTLGGGNHFIEFQKTPDDNIGIMIHSGSRKLGELIWKYYNDIAETLCHQWYYHDVVKNGLAFLPADDYNAKDYLDSMNFALEFAEQSRALMMSRVINIFFNLISKYVGQIQKEILWEEDVHHNYAALENHFDRNLIVHRKGAIRARKKDIVIIPGSMGSPSYIGIGKENTDSFHSCSHGAGRSMGRKAANRNIDPDTAEKSVAGVFHMPFNGDYGEAKEAYKDISEVITNQTDLIDVTMKLQPLINIKDNTVKKKK